MRVFAVQRPGAGIQHHTSPELGRLLFMVIAQPERGGLLPERTAPQRGSLATTACMETLQVGYLHAVAAAVRPR